MPAGPQLHLASALKAYERVCYNNACFHLALPTPPPPRPPLFCRAALKQQLCHQAVMLLGALSKRGLHLHTVPPASPDRPLPASLTEEEGGSCSGASLGSAVGVSEVARAASAAPAAATHNTIDQGPMPQGAAAAGAASATAATPATSVTPATPAAHPSAAAAARVTFPMVTAGRILLLSDIHVDRPGGHNVKALQSISGTAFMQDVLLVPGVREGLGVQGQGESSRQ